MAITILPRENTLGEQLGTGLGSGIQSGIENLIKHRIHSMQLGQQQQRSSTGLQALGFAPEEAASLALLDPKIQQEIVKRKLIAPQEQAYSSALQQLLGGAQPQEQQTQAGSSQPSISSLGGLNQQQATKLTELGLKQRELKDKQAIQEQRTIEKLNAPFKKYLETSVEPARDVNNLVDEALQLLDSGKIQLGAIKSLTPDRFQNEETQAFLGKINELVTKKAQLGKGVPSRARLLLEQASKPQLWQKPGAVKYLLNSIKTNVQAPLELEAITNKLIEQTGKEPKHLKQQVYKQYAYNNLPNPKDYSDDTEIEIEGYKFKKDGDSWKEIKG